MRDELKECGEGSSSSPPRALPAAVTFPCGVALSASRGAVWERPSSPEVRLVTDRSVRSPFPVKVAEVWGL